MALNTIGQKTVGTSAVRFTATTGQSLQGSYGIKFGYAGSNSVFYGYTSAVTTGTGFPLVAGYAEVSPAECDDPSTIYLISDTAAQQVGYVVVGKAITIS